MIPYYKTPDIRELMFGYVVLNSGFVYATVASLNVFIPELMFDRKPSATPTPVPIKNVYKSTQAIHTASSVQSLNFVTIPTSDAFRHLYKEYELEGGYYKPKKIRNGDRVAIYINNFDIDDAMIVPF